MIPKQHTTIGSRLIVDSVNGFSFEDKTVQNCPIFEHLFSGISTWSISMLKVIIEEEVLHTETPNSARKQLKNAT